MDPNMSAESVVCCTVCALEVYWKDFVTFSQCGHSFCKVCVQTHFYNVVTRGSCKLTCLMCPTPATEPEVMGNLEVEMYQRYLEHALRRYLALHFTNVRRCIAPDCPFLYILENPSCCTDEHFVCQNLYCGIDFCYICKSPWHEGMNCSKAKMAYPDFKDLVPQESESLTKEEMKLLNIKLCPRCSTITQKIDDGACNHVECSMCHLEFCWLCLRPSSDVHYLSPTGCPMFGNRRWSWWKRWIFRLCIWIGAPIGLLLIAIIMFFICLIAIPILVGYFVLSLSIVEAKKLYVRMFICVIAVFIAVVLSPFVSFIIAAIIIPLGLCYAYVFIPIHLLRTFTGGIPDSGYRV